MPCVGTSPGLRIPVVTHPNMKNNHWTSLKAARKREAAFTELFDLLSAHNVPGLLRLLSTAKNEGWGTNKTTQKSQLAIEGKYHARNYTEFDRDLGAAQLSMR
ncbi:hypothetical protein R3P38DRAFT_2814113 [Favolaschia claudopus]|uniref:Arginine kinase n=1 Tax=Favolaschia claudopus TaxID=2862362 RepID=A0AAV9Z5E5_9AGAR